MTRLQSTVRNYVENRPRHAGYSFEILFPDVLFPNVSSVQMDLNAGQARDLLSKMLVIDPERRISVEGALNHPYIRLWREESEVNAPAPNSYDESFEQQDRTVDQWKGKFTKVSTWTWSHRHLFLSICVDLIYSEVKNYETINRNQLDALIRTIRDESTE